MRQPGAHDDGVGDVTKMLRSLRRPPPRPSLILIFCRDLSRRAGKSTTGKGRDKSDSLKKLVNKKDALLISVVGRRILRGSVPSRGLIQSILGELRYCSQQQNAIECRGSMTTI